MATLPGRQALMVRYLRDWCDSADGQIRVWSDLATRLGPARGQAALKAFEDMVAILLAFGRRPLVRHQANCTCVGSDEAVVALMVSTAASGAEEEAMMIGALLVRADMIRPLVDAAMRRGVILPEIAAAPIGAVNTSKH
jgi:hypothetical protein